MTTHLEVWAAETYVPASETAWFAWVDRVETILGHSLDGDQDTDGYSLGVAYDAWERGVTPSGYVSAIPAREEA